MSGFAPTRSAARREAARRSRLASRHAGRPAHRGVLCRAGLVRHRRSCPLSRQRAVPVRLPLHQLLVLRPSVDRLVGRSGALVCADLDRPALLFLLALVLFWATGDFLLFGVATTLVILVFMGDSHRPARSRRSSPLRLRPDAVSRTGIAGHLRQFWNSLSVHPVRTAGPELSLRGADRASWCRSRPCRFRYGHESLPPRHGGHADAGGDFSAANQPATRRRRHAERAARPAAGDGDEPCRNGDSRSRRAVLLASRLQPLAWPEQCGASDAAAPAAALIVLTSGVLPAGGVFPQLSERKGVAIRSHSPGWRPQASVVYAATIRLLSGARILRCSLALSVSTRPIGHGFFGTLSVDQRCLLSATIGRYKDQSALLTRRG